MPGSCVLDRVVPACPSALQLLLTSTLPLLDSHSDRINLSSEGNTTPLLTVLFPLTTKLFKEVELISCHSLQSSLFGFHQALQRCPQPWEVLLWKSQLLCCQIQLSFSTFILLELLVALDVAGHRPSLLLVQRCHITALPSSSLATLAAHSVSLAVRPLLDL